MKTSLSATTGVAVAIPLLALSAAGCHSSSKPSTATTASTPPSAASRGTAPTSANAPATDYTKLLIHATDINAPVTFTAGPPIQNPNGRQGAAMTFTEQDGDHVIRDTILILPDPAAAAGALAAAKAAPPLVDAGKPVAANVGAGGTIISGKSPNGSQGVTTLLFTEGRAFVTLEFDGPKDIAAPTDFVTDVGRKQDAAIKQGLSP
ncbi:hypothetical protein [Mycobacterium botniense]|uniref:Lipoprotein LpqN n=1 Tax=Mycobacterium botniense TaxID=84962 RepID=A0A7I9Y0D4_9MYCO|nr:hypothetical protein [Mycobacterium botniense]GFG75437.1 hypothetical protein MBOT_28020 [Mycobacterium botniense]